MSACLNCVHYRFSDPPNPLRGVRLTSAKTLELRAKWQRDLSELAMGEQEAKEMGQPLDHEPVAYPYCLHYSLEESGGEPLTLWVLCETANSNNECFHFESVKT